MLRRVPRYRPDKRPEDADTIEIVRSPNALNTEPRGTHGPL